MGRTKTLVFAVLGVVFAAAAMIAGTGSAAAAIEERAVGGFTSVTLAAPGAVHIAVTGFESLTIEAEPHVLPLLTSDVIDGRLVLANASFPPIVTNQPIVYTLTVRELDDVRVTSAGSITIDGLATDSFGATIDGTGNVTVRGTADRSTVDVRGTGSYTGDGFLARDVVVNVLGTGSAVVAASNTLNATVSGPGSVRYVGDPVLQANVAFPGSIGKY